MAINSARGASLMCLRRSVIRSTASRARSCLVAMGASRAAGLLYLVIVKLSPRATRSSSLDRCFWTSEAPIVSTIFPLCELGHRIYNKPERPAESQLGVPFRTDPPGKSLIDCVGHKPETILTFHENRFPSWPAPSTRIRPQCFVYVNSDFKGRNNK